MLDHQPLVEAKQQQNRVGQGHGKCSGIYGHCNKEIPDWTDAGG